MIKVFFLGLFIFNSIPALAEKELDKFGISADSMDRDYDKGVIYLKGHVNLSFGKKKLTANSAEIWYQTKLVVAEGQAVIAADKFQMQGDRIEYDYGNDVGKIFSGAVKSGKVSFKGEELIKMGENEFHADYGSYTACDCDPPTWSFSGHDIDAEVGSYAYVKWPILRVSSVPIFALPYIIVPLKSSRQSGLLIPTYESTHDGGSTFGEGFFWAINESSDATITAKNYALRGLKGLLEYRKRFSNDSYFFLNGSLMNDQNVKNSSRYEFFEPGNINADPTAPLLSPINAKDYDRWFLKIDQYLELPENYTQRIQANLISDLQYLSDFYQEIEGAGAPALENHYSLTKRRESLVFVFDTTMYTDLLKKNPLIDSSESVHRFPEIRLSYLEKPIGISGFSFRLDSQYVNFARNGQSWDDICVYTSSIPIPGCPPPPSNPTPSSSNPVKVWNPTRDGYFNAQNDLLRTGQRLDFQPTLSYSFHLGDYIDMVPSVTYRETYYQFPISQPDFPETANRSYFQTQLSTRMKAYRIYGDDKSKLKHEIVPEILWTNTPLISQPDHPFFGTSAATTNFRLNQPITDQDFYSANKLQFDYNDRIYDRGLITLMLANKFIRKKYIENNPYEYKQVGIVRVWQTYDFIEASRSGVSPKPWSEINSLFDFRFDNFETNALFQYYPYHGVTNSSIRMKVIKSGNFAEVTYTEKFIIPTDTSTYVPESTRTQNISPRLGIYSRYLNLSGGPDYNIVSSTFNSWSADLGIKPPGNCIIIGVNITQPPGGTPAFTAKFNMSFDGT